MSNLIIPLYHIQRQQQSIGVATGSGGISQQQNILAGQHQSLQDQQDLAARISTVSSSVPQQVMTIVSAPTLSSNAQGALYSAASSVQIPNSPSRPSILRRREGERDIPGNNLSSKISSSFRQHISIPLQL